MAIDKLGRLWVGHLNTGVSVFNGETWKNYDVIDGPIGERIFDIQICPVDGNAEEIGKNTAKYTISASCDPSSLETDEVKPVNPAWTCSCSEITFIPLVGVQPMPQNPGNPNILLSGTNPWTAKVSSPNAGRWKLKFTVTVTYDVWDKKEDKMKTFQCQIKGDDVMLVLRVFFIYSTIILNGILNNALLAWESDYSIVREANTVQQITSVISDTHKWDLLTKKELRIEKTDDVFVAIELLGAIRTEEGIDILIPTIKYPTRLYGGLSRGFRDDFVTASLIRIIRNKKNFDSLLQYSALNTISDSCSCCLRGLLPWDSSIALIDHFIEERTKDIDSELPLSNLLSLKRKIELLKTVRPEPLPPLSDFVLNHPLYKVRQTVIETNIAVFKERKRPTELDEKLLKAVEKLGEVRAAEAVEVLVPYLLLKAKSELKPTERKPDEKLVALAEYPIAVTLAEIGIPSIWGLLDEIAKREKDAGEYRNIACKVMTAILPAVAIPGFVSTVLEKQNDEITKLRLAKLFPLLGVQDSPLLVPSFREWETTDGFFKTTAKFVALTKGDVTLEKPDGKRTTIELKALRKIDQDYVNEQVKTEEK